MDLAKKFESELITKMQRAKKSVSITLLDLIKCSQSMAELKQQSILSRAELRQDKLQMALRHCICVVV